MQYIQLQGQVAADLDLPLEGSYNLFIDTSDNSIKAKDSEGNLTGGGGISLIETTREAVGQLVVSASLTPGAFYKIAGAASQSFLDTNEFSYSGYGNEIQKGGTTIILQATTDKTLSKKGIGLFYVPNYEDPNNPTAPPDYNYLTWDNTHRIYFDSLNGTLPIGANVTLYSDDTENSTTASLEGSLEGSGSGYVTLRLGNNDTFFEDVNNLNQLQIQYSGISGSFVSNPFGDANYTSSYQPGDCVIFGGRVWQNLSGSIGYREGGNQWPTNALNLNPEDWTPVAFNETHYTISADLIEYDFEYDNISYRNDGKNEVRCEWYWWDDNYGYNTIGYFPWGHKVVNNVSFTNTYLHHFVNFPWDSEAGQIKFGHNSTFNATTWGHQSYFYSMYGEEGANFGGNRFGRGTDIWDIRFAIDAEMRNIQTGGTNNQIYEITIGSNASFYGVDMYYSSEIYDVEIGTEAYFGSSDHYEYTNVYDVQLGIDASLSEFTLMTYSEIKDVTIGVNSSIQYFTLNYSSCLKRTTIATDGYISWFDIGVDSFIRQVNLSDRAYITSFEIGNNANLQNIDLGAYAYMEDFNGGYSTDFQNIRLDAKARIYDVYLGYESEFSEIQIAPNGYIYNVNDNINPSPFTGSYISGITIEPHSYISNIEIGTNASLQNIYLGTNSIAGEFTLEEGSNISDINQMGSGGFGGILLCSGSEITDFQVGMDCGFGEFTITGSASLSNFELGNGQEFGGTTFTSSLNNITLTKQFKNLYNTTTQSLDAGLGGTGYPLIDFTNRSIVTIDISGATTPYNFDLPDGDYEGQELTFIVKSDGTHSILPDDVQLWSSNIVLTGYEYNLGDYNGAIKPFARLNVTDTGDTTIWKNMSKAVWTGGKWYSDAEAYND
jgi:hypothetical protein